MVDARVVTLECGGWKPPMTGDEILAALLALNLERAGAADPVPNAEVEDDTEGVEEE